MDVVAEASTVALRCGRDCGAHGASGALDVPDDKHDRHRREVRKHQPQQTGLIIAREVPRDTLSSDPATAPMTTELSGRAT
jgi:hypothetical protein